MADISITVQFNSEWTGYIKASLYNCGLADSILITVKEALQPFSLGSDKVLCAGDSLNIAAPSGFVSYKWNTGNTAKEISATTVGSYFVKASDYCGNIFADTIEIQNPDKTFPIINNVQICNQDSFFITKSPDFNNYNWLPVTGTGFVNNYLYFVSAQVTTAYTLQVMDLYGCKWQQQFTVTVQEWPPDSPDIWFPSGFTPNNDGHNDSFGPLVKGNWKIFSFKVYNRWGQLVFSSNNPSDKWNGKVRAVDTPSGIYVRSCNYHLTINLQFFEREWLL